MSHSSNSKTLWSHSILGLNTQTPNPNNHTKPNIASHSSKIFKHSDHNQSLVFRGLSPPTTSGFLEQMVRCVPLNAARLSPLSLKELWVKTLMHRTSGTILATSRNKVKHLSPLHCFTQPKGYNTRTNPLPLLHTGEEDPFPLLHTSERVFTGFLGMENLAQHLIPARTFKHDKTLSTCNTSEFTDCHKFHTITSCMGNNVR